jgi:hypothetical protein
MGIYLNQGNDSFQSSINSEIYIDKTELIAYTNRVLGSKQKRICVSRPRRFGKSMAAEMLSAYYDKSCDSEELFKHMKIFQNPTFKKHLNKYDVLHIDVQWIRSNVKSGGEAVEMLQKEVIRELWEAYPEYIEKEDTMLPVCLAKINNATGIKFVIIIDEWDCLFREDKYDEKAQQEYVALLRGLFKGTQSEKFILLAYITGILPIKKYGTESALNNFNEFTMLEPDMLADYVGFNEDEVHDLCKKYSVDFEETKNWYDGYQFYGKSHVYSPKSVVDAMLRRRIGNYWTSSETYESLKVYISMNYEGLKDDIIFMLGGGRCKIDTSTFENDMTSFQGKDDVLTLLIHLGYLAYDNTKEEIYIPNEEVRLAFTKAIKKSGWQDVTDAISASETLLAATLQGDERAVEEGIDKVHMENVSILSYNDENSLSCVIMLAYYSAVSDYIKIRELPTGKGFADVVFLPKKHSDKPALLVELKWDKNAEGAIKQIKEKKYVSSLKDYAGDILMVAINYDKKSKVHQCRIEKVCK